MRVTVFYEQLIRRDGRSICSLREWHFELIEGGKVCSRKSQRHAIEIKLFVFGV